MRGRSGTRSPASSSSHRTRATTAWGQPSRTRGTIDGDGAPDLAISANGSSPVGRTNAGVVFVLSDASSLPSRVDLAAVGKSVPGTIVLGVVETTDEARGSRIGNDLVPAGDFNGDGYDDLGITAHALYPRRFYLVLGGPDLPPVLDLADPEQLREHVIVFSSLPLFAERRESAGLGDINGDAFADLLFRRGLREDEAAFLFYGRADFPRIVDLEALPAGLATKISPIVDNERFLEGFGGSVAAAGDLNADGVPDLLIGAQDMNVSGQAHVGEAYAVFGSRDFPAHVPLADGFAGIRMLGEGPADFFGWRVAGARDFNGDGAPDILVGADQIDTETTGSPPRVYLIYGSGSPRARPDARRARVPGVLRPSSHPCWRAAAAVWGRCSRGHRSSASQTSAPPRKPPAWEIASGVPSRPKWRISRKQRPVSAS